MALPGPVCVLSVWHLDYRHRSGSLGLRDQWASSCSSLAQGDPHEFQHFSPIAKRARAQEPPAVRDEVPDYLCDMVH